MFDSGSEGEFPDEFTGDWVYADGEWHAEILNPYDLDPTAEVTGGQVVGIAGCPSGAGLAIALAGTADSAVDDPMVLDRIVGFERLAAWAAAGQARALAELTARRTADDPNELPFAVEEVSLALSCSRMAAGTKVALATDLAERLPETLTAWQDGRICASRARVLSEGTRRLSAENAAFVEVQLLGPAATLSPARLRVRVAVLADSLDPRDIEDKHADAAEGRRVVKEPREDGMACLWALLPADHAATVWAGLNARAETTRQPDDTRTADQRRADSLTGLAVDYLTGGRPPAAAMSTGPTATTNGPTSTATPSLAGLVGGPDSPIGTSGIPGLPGLAGLANSPSGIPGLAVPGRPGTAGAVGVPPVVPRWAQVQVTVPAGLLLGTSTEPAVLAGHGPIPASMALRLAADAQWQRIVYSPLTGALLDVGTTRHDPPPALREFVLARDRTCTWGNCAQPRVDLDHVIPYPDGHTSAANLDAKCRHHHRTKQHPKFGYERHPDGSSTITTPTWHTYPSPARDHRPPPRRTRHPGSDDEPPPF